MLKGKGLNEHQLIQEYFSDIGSDFLVDQKVLKGVGDDAASYEVAEGYELILSTDTSVKGVHFLNNQSPDDIAYRSVAVALSDLAACGAVPSWFMISITLENNNNLWLKSFSDGLHEIAKQFRIPLIGGDTTRGPLTITVQVGGLVKKGRMINRSSANVGDLIFVSGIIGAASLGLNQLKNLELNQTYVEKYTRPVPRFDLTQILKETATSAIDISDGLIQDINHICLSSKVGALIKFNDIPFPEGITHKEKKIIVSSSDDYEICFTVPKIYKDKLLALSKSIDITEIGYIHEGTSVSVENEKQEIIDIDTGYSHF